MDRQRPIGWYLRRLDELLEQVVERAVAGEGLTRRHWQVLSDVVDGGTAGAALGPFDGVDAARAELVRRGWLEQADDGVRVTGTGRAAHRRLLGSVVAARRAVTAGIGAEEYQRTVATLARMVADAERALSG